MPQATDIYDESLIDLNSWQLLQPKWSDVGSGMGISYVYPKYAYTYSFESYSGSEIGGSWCPVSEAKFSRLLRFAFALRWDLIEQVAV